MKLLHFFEQTPIIHSFVMSSSYLLIDPLPRTRNRFLAPLFVLTPDLKRNDVNKKLLLLLLLLNQQHLDQSDDNTIPDDDEEEEEEPRFRPKIEELDDPNLLHNNDIVIL